MSENLVQSVLSEKRSWYMQNTTSTDSTIPAQLAHGNLVGTVFFCPLGEGLIQISTCFQETPSGDHFAYPLQGLACRKGAPWIKCLALDSQAHLYIAMRCYFHKPRLTQQAWSDSWLEFTPSIPFRFFILPSCRIKARSNNQISTPLFKELINYIVNFALDSKFVCLRAYQRQSP